MSKWNLDSYEELLEAAQVRRGHLLAEKRRLTAYDLPLRQLRQEAHFTTPASNYEMVTKAVERGAAATPRILQKFDISLDTLGDVLGVPTAELEKELQRDPQPPLVMVDGEDAQALRDDVIERGRENAIEAFREVAWNRTLRYYRPSGLGLEYSMGDLVIVLSQVAEGREPSNYPIDGIIWPKVDHPDELKLVDETLSNLEQRIGLSENQIKMQFLVESGWSLAQLPELVKPIMRRLSGIVFGIADYSADVGLPVIENNHPVCDYTRAGIVNLAGALGVPAIDNMTVNYPVADRNLSLTDNRKLLLTRLRETYQDALHGQKLGMSGKWVGHPLQLFVVRLAYRLAFPEAAINSEMEKIEAYSRAVEAEVGATMIAGAMSDRATDRHSRELLRKAFALGYLEAERGVRAGIITAEEANSLRGVAA
jgi:citrate lyase beta subunit